MLVLSRNNDQRKSTVSRSLLLSVNEPKDCDLLVILFQDGGTKIV